MKLFALTLILFSTTALSSEVWVDVNIGSKHSQENYYAPYTETYSKIQQTAKAGINNTAFGTRQVCCKANRLNENNLGLGVSYRRKYLEYKIGAFRNSYRDVSTYAAVNAFHKFHITKKVLIVPGLALSAFTGYKKSPGIDSAVIFVPIPNVSLENKKLRAVLGYVPGKRLSKTGIDVLTLQVGYKIK